MQAVGNAAGEPGRGSPFSLDTFAAMLSVDGGPFLVAQICAATLQMHQELELASLRAQLQASVKGTVELFCALARHAPEHLPGTWAAVYDMVVAEERFWIYPKVTLGAIEDGMDEAFTPYLSREKVAAEWETLLTHVHRVLSVQDSAKRNALTA